jgi:methionyl-tRNA formyltransferase
LIAATYHRKIRLEVLNRCKLALNLHPSLLPRNRGPSPIFWSIRRGDAEAGVSAHALSERVDDGPICMQRRVPIGPDETQSSLRRRLGDTAATMAVAIVTAHRTNALHFRSQKSYLATNYGRVSKQNRQLDLTETAISIRRHVNALRNWPLAELGTDRVKWVAAIEPPSDCSLGTVLARSRFVCRVRVADADVVLQLEPKPDQARS